MDSTPNNKTHLTEYFSKLPEILQDYILSEHFATTIESILAQDLSPELTAENKIVIENQFILLLMLTTPLITFEEFLTSQLDLREDVIHNILTTFLEQIPNEIHSILIEMSDILTRQTSIKTEETISDLQNLFPPPSIQSTDSSNQTSAQETSAPTLPEGKTKNHTPAQPPVGMRTMETDINRIHGYGAYRAKFPDEEADIAHKEEVIRSASQDELLQEKPTLANMPTYEEGEEDETKV